MPAWQIALEFFKVIGLGPLIGVFIGAGINRRSKSQETLQSIRSANYRETVATYERLDAATLEAVLAASNAISNTRLLIDGPPSIKDSTHPAVRQNIESAWQDQLDRLEVASDVIGNQVIKLEIHHPDSIIFNCAEMIRISSIGLSGGISVAKFLDDKEQLKECGEVLNELKKQASRLRIVWADWKLKAEFEAAGLRPPLRDRFLASDVWYRMTRRWRMRRTDKRAPADGTKNRGD